MAASEFFRYGKYDLDFKSPDDASSIEDILQRYTRAGTIVPSFFFAHRDLYLSIVAMSDQCFRSSEFITLTTEPVSWSFTDNETSERNNKIEVIASLEI
ncbi:hypothetical protein STEG23_006196 [Scotinomys teguina]